MKNVLVFLFVLVSSCTFSQEKHNNCVAVFIGEDMVVDEYSPRGKSIIDASSKGWLTVNMVELGENTAVKGKSVKYFLAVRDAKTESLTMLTSKATDKQALVDVLVDFEKGDKLIVLLEDDEYALPHYEIEITK